MARRASPGAQSPRLALGLVALLLPLAGLLASAPALAAEPYTVTINVIGNSGVGCFKLWESGEYGQAFAALAGDCSAGGTPSLGASASEYCANLAAAINDPSTELGSDYLGAGFPSDTAWSASCADTTLTVNYDDPDTPSDGVVVTSGPDFGDGTPTIVHPAGASAETAGPTVYVLDSTTSTIELDRIDDSLQTLDWFACWGLLIALMAGALMWGWRIGRRKDRQ